MIRELVMKWLAQSVTHLVHR